MAKKLAKKQNGGSTDLKKAKQDSAAARTYIKNNKSSGDMSQSVM